MLNADVIYIMLKSLGVFPSCCFLCKEIQSLIRGVNFSTLQMLKWEQGLKWDAAWLLDKLCHLAVQFFTNFAAVLNPERGLVKGSKRYVLNLISEYS